jgi:hypothetical protein
MKRWLDTPFTLSGNGLAVGAKGDSTRLIIMQCGDPLIGMIGLLEWIEPRHEFPPVPESVHIGMPIFVMATDDARGVCERASATAGRVYAETYEWSYTSPDGTNKNFLSCSIFDLDGYFFEVNQTL